MQGSTTKDDTTRHDRTWQDTGGGGDWGRTRHNMNMNYMVKYKTRHDTKTETTQHRIKIMDNNTTRQVTEWETTRPTTHDTEREDTGNNIARRDATRNMSEAT